MDTSEITYEMICGTTPPAVWATVADGLFIATSEIAGTMLVVFLSEDIRSGMDASIQLMLHLSASEEAVVERASRA